jgi:phage-related minor tail protein
MSEYGPEAIMPLTRNAQGKLGVTVSGDASGGSNITYNNHFTVTSNSDDPKQVSLEVMQAIARKEAQNAYNQNAGRTTGRR